jgi:hypothetical protein
MAKLLSMNLLALNALHKIATFLSSNSTSFQTSPQLFSSPHYLFFMMHWNTKISKGIMA